jgi:predicted Zn-dependent protease with MMP-like domain
MRGILAPAQVPASRSRSEIFDDLVLDAVDELEIHWAAELAGIEFAVEEVPPGEAADALSSDLVLDRGVVLGQLFREGIAELHSPTVMVYRRPVEARASDPEDRAELVFMVVAELIAELLGRDIDEIDPA